MPKIDTPQYIKNWSSEDDLRTLINEKKIRSDRKRLGAAMEKHKQLSYELGTTAKPGPGWAGGATGNKAKNPVAPKYPPSAVAKGRL